MKKIHILSTIFATVALSALMAANAPATLWLDNGTSVLEAKEATWHWTFQLHHVVLFVETVIECSGLFLGTVGGPKGVEDLISAIHNLSNTELNLIACTNVKNCTKPVKHFLNLPWATELLLTNNKTDDHFFAEPQGGLPKVEILCEGGLKASCEALINLFFDENLANGALFLATKEGTVTKSCSDGGESWTTGMGEFLLYTVS
jgi:hypothetical protein